MIDLEKYRIVDYKIAETAKLNKRDFEKDVQRLINEGYIPLGGIACGVHVYQFYQAMAKVEPKAK